MSVNAPLAILSSKFIVRLPKRSSLLFVSLISNRSQASACASLAVRTSPPQATLLLKRGLRRKPRASEPRLMKYPVIHLSKRVELLAFVLPRNNCRHAHAGKLERGAPLGGKSHVGLTHMVAHAQQLVATRPLSRTQERFCTAGIVPYPEPRTTIKTCTSTASALCLFASSYTRAVKSSGSVSSKRDENPCAPHPNLPKAAFIRNSSRKQTYPLPEYTCFHAETPPS